MTLVLALLLTLIIPAQMSVFVEKVEAQDVELVNVFIGEENGTLIYAQVPQNKVEQYQKSLEVKRYKDAELSKVLLRAGGFKSANPPLPPGRVISQKDMTIADVKAYVDRVAGAGTYARIIAKGTSEIGGIVSAILDVAGVPNLIGVFSDLFGRAVEYLHNQNENWWRTSLELLIKGDIYAVRETFIENTVSEYPKAYLLYHRITK